MFDNVHLHTNGRQHPMPTSVTIHEHRAPTDASIKLAEEMERKVLDRLVATTKVPNSEIQCVIHSMRSSGLGGGWQLIVVYRINGKQRRLDYTPDWFKENTPELIMQGLQKAMATDVANNVLGEGLPELMKDPNAAWIRGPLR